MGLDKNDIKALIAILQKGLVDENEEDITNSEENLLEEDNKESNINNKNKSKNTKKKISSNKFLQMKEKDLFKSDSEIDRKLKKYPPTERRTPFKGIKVRCRVCGKEDSVNPNIVESADRYKCNRCARTSG